MKELFTEAVEPPPMTEEEAEAARVAAEEAAGECRFYTSLDSLHSSAESSNRVIAKKGCGIQWGELTRERTRTQVGKRWYESTYFLLH